MCYIMDFVIPMDHHIKENEEEKVDKYMDMVAQVIRQFLVKTVILGTVPAKLSESLKKFEIADVIRSLETEVLISIILLKLCLEYASIYLSIYLSIYILNMK